MIRVDAAALIDMHTSEGHIVAALSEALERIEVLEKKILHERTLSDEILQDAIEARNAIKGYLIREIMDTAFSAIDRRVRNREWL
jgi:hypothetical protein